MATDYFELSRLLANRRAGMGNPGASEFGALLGGGGKAREQQIFNQSALQGARMQDVLANARLSQAKGIQFDREQAARQSLSNRYRSQGQGDLADMFAGYDNPDQVAQARLGLLKAKAMQQALDLANNPNVDYNHLNAIKMATAADPTQLVRNLGDGSYTTNAYRTDQPVQLSDIGRAFVGEKAAQAGAANAAAAQHYAGANLDKARTDQVKGGGAGKPQALTSEMTKAFFSKPVLDQDGKQATDSQGRPVTQIDTGKMANFMQFADRPGVSANQNAALPQYMNTYGAQNDNPPAGAMDLGDAFAAKQANDAKVNSILAAAPDPQRARELFNQSTTAQPTAKIATPQSQADFDALPSGATYVNPADGKTYRKK